MIQVKFRNLERSEIARDIVLERTLPFIEKFKDLKSSKISITLEMHNSPTQPGPDYFSVKIYIANGRYKGMSVQKSNTTLYKALADVIDHLLEKLNRAGDKQRVRARTMERKMNQQSMKGLT